LAKVINDVFEEPTTQNQSQRNRMDFFRRMRRGGPGGPGDSSSDSGTSEAKTAAVKVTAVGDERSNSVVVSAASEVMLQISTLVKQVDVPTEDDAIVEVFSLKYADAEDTVDVLKEIYSSSDTQDSNVPGQRRFGFFGMRGGPPGMNNNSSSRTLGQADVALVADTRTNSVVVSASPTTMAAITKVIERLDATPKNVTQVYIYKIENADLENLQEILQGMFDDIEDTGTTTTLAPGGGARTGTTGASSTRRN
jgi:type II secretory pathway component GspD/PulD (secretin)